MACHFWVCFMWLISFPGQLFTFYVYRAQGETTYPPENVNVADLGGVMWYHGWVVSQDIDAYWQGSVKISNFLGNQIIHMYGNFGRFPLFSMHCLGFGDIYIYIYIDSSKDCQLTLKASTFFHFFKWSIAIQGTFIMRLLAALIGATSASYWTHLRGFPDMLVRGMIWGEVTGMWCCDLRTLDSRMSTSSVTH